MTLQGLTPLERKTFNALIKHLKRAGTAPSMRGLQSSVGMTSASGTHRIIWSLARKGWVKVSQYQARSMVPTEEALQFCERIARVSPPFDVRPKARTRLDGGGGQSEGAA